MNKKPSTRLLGELLPNGCDMPQQEASREITGVAFDSRQVRPRNIFVALSGSNVDGASFITSAVDQGATAIVTERTREELSGVPSDVVVLTVPDSRQALAEISVEFYGHPERLLDLLGVVGTNGKTTVATGLCVVSETLGHASGVIGTVEYAWNNKSWPAQLTTPEAPEISILLASMRDDSVRRVFMEVSSVAISQKRDWGLEFRGGVFTNLSRDHLDFHGDMTNYKNAKREFFERLSDPSRFAVVNRDADVWQEFVAASAPGNVMTYSVNPDSGADVVMTVGKHSLDGTEGQISFRGQAYRFRSPLWGRFNHENLSAIASTLCALGDPPDGIAESLAEFTGVRGRSQRLVTNAPFDVFVDFAHTPDGLNNLLSAVRPLAATRGRLIVLFGCGGSRDRGKRVPMAQAVERWADVITVTSDNPRKEDPEAILRDVQQGLTGRVPVTALVDRAEAIRESLRAAQPGDVIFLCGKGHEQTQTFADRQERFDDAEIAQAALRELGYD